MDDLGGSFANKLKCGEVSKSRIRMGNKQGRKRGIDYRYDGGI